MEMVEGRTALTMERVDPVNSTIQKRLLTRQKWGDFGIREKGTYQTNTKG